MLGLAEAGAVEKEGAAKQQHPPSGSAESSTLASTDAGKGRTDATLEPANSSNPYQLAIDEFGLPVALQQQSEGASTLAAEETLAAHGTSMADLATAGTGFGHGGRSRLRLELSHSSNYSKFFSFGSPIMVVLVTKYIVALLKVRFGYCILLSVFQDVLVRNPLTGLLQVPTS